MAFDPALGTSRDYIRFRLQDTDDANLLIAEATYDALIDKLGAREAARQCAMTLAAYYSGVNVRDGDVTENLQQAAEFYKSLASELAGDPNLDDAGLGIAGASVGILTTPDLSEYEAHI